MAAASPPVHFGPPTTIRNEPSAFGLNVTRIVRAAGDGRGDVASARRQRGEASRRSCRSRRRRSGWGPCRSRRPPSVSARVAIAPLARRGRVATRLQVDRRGLRGRRVGAGDVDDELVLVGAHVRGRGHAAARLAVGRVVEVDGRLVVRGAGHRRQPGNHQLSEAAVVGKRVGAVELGGEPVRRPHGDAERAVADVHRLPGQQRRAPEHDVGPAHQVGRVDVELAGVPSGRRRLRRRGRAHGHRRAYQRRAPARRPCGSRHNSVSPS